MRRRILVPVEDSTISRRAVAFAVSLAESHDFEIYLFSVGTKKDYGKLQGEELKKAVDAALADMDRILVDALVQLGRQRTIDFSKLGQAHKRFSVGSLQTEILRMAGNISSELIVLGVSSHVDADHGAAKFEFDAKLIGNLVAEAPCSVLAVKTLDETFVIV